MIKEMREVHVGRAGNASGPNARFERVDSVDDLDALSGDAKFRRVTACDRPSSCQDGLLDVVSIRGAFHLGQIRVGLSNAQKICQCREVTIEIKRKVSVQIDGEPWRQDVSTLRVHRKKDAAIMLHRSAVDSNGVETEMANLLDWAEDKQLITEQIHAALMQEFSRRIESKTRQRREQNNRQVGFSLTRAIASSGNMGGGGGSSAGIMF
jgi:Diacylglycerol kinase accessory domain